MIYEINHIWTAEMKWKWRSDRRSERNLCNCVKKPEKKTRWSPDFFSGFFTQLHKLRSLRRSFLHFHFISAVHIWFISCIINTHFFREHINPQLTCSQSQCLHSSVGRTSHRYRQVTGSNPVEVLDFFQASLRNCINCVHYDDHFFIFIK